MSPTNGQPQYRTTEPALYLSDDQGSWAMGCAGNEEIRSPAWTAWRSQVNIGGFMRKISSKVV